MFLLLLILVFGVNSIQVFKESHLLKIPTLDHTLIDTPVNFKFLLYYIVQKKIQQKLVYKECYYKIRQIELLKQETNSKPKQ